MDANCRRCEKVLGATQQFFGGGFVHLVRAPAFLGEQLRASWHCLASLGRVRPTLDSPELDFNMAENFIKIIETC
jgi:hypothetical protein